MHHVPLRHRPRRRTVIRALAAAAVFLAAAVTSSHAALEGRDLDGDLASAEAYYDTALDITWLADANHARTTAYQPPVGPMVVEGQLSWDAAGEWRIGIQIGGVGGWRLPGMLEPPACAINESSDYDCRYTDTSSNELRSLFLHTLGAGQIGPFVNVTGTYWLSQDYYVFDNHVPNATQAWSVDSATASQFTWSKQQTASAWLVHDGAVGVSLVPEPGSALMFLGGLLTLRPVCRRLHRPAAA